MKKVVISQTGPAIGSGEVAFMCGIEGERYIDAFLTIRDAIEYMGQTGEFPDNVPFTIEYRPFNG